MCAKKPLRRAKDSAVLKVFAPNAVQATCFHPRRSCISPSAGLIRELLEALRENFSLAVFNLNPAFCMACYHEAQLFCGTVAGCRIAHPSQRLRRNTLLSHSVSPSPVIGNPASSQWSKPRSSAWCSRDLIDLRSTHSTGSHKRRFAPIVDTKEANNPV